jgi:hypothetical protein
MRFGEAGSGETVSEKLSRDLGMAAGDAEAEPAVTPKSSDASFQRHCRLGCGGKIVAQERARSTVRGEVIQLSHSC